MNTASDSKDPFSDIYYIPSDQAGMIFHAEFNSVGLIALIAPTFTPGLSHFGIAAVVGREWKFITGPAIIRTDRIWRKLHLLDPPCPYCPTDISWLAKTDDWSIPTASPDDFIDLVTGDQGGRTA